MRAGYVYIMANWKNGTLYVGSTSDLGARVAEHKAAANDKSFTARYSLNRLIYYEFYEDSGEAIAREKALKRYKRSWKIELIEADNPEWWDIPLNYDD